MAKTVLVTGAGGAASIGFTRSLRLSKEKYRIVGVDSNRFKACLSEADETHIVPRPDEPGYIDALNSVIDRCSVDFLHAQPWEEVLKVSENREKIHAKTFLPSKKAVKRCTDKYQSYVRWRDAGLTVPRTWRIDNGLDLYLAFRDKGAVRWVRACEGAGGLGAIATDNEMTARIWIGLHKDKCSMFMVSEYLSPRSTTWMSLWRNGMLIVAQGRERLYWEGGSKFLSGVSGMTGACKTVSDPQVSKIAMDAIYAVDSAPNGIWSVDLTYDKDGVPNPTEINIGKFFTTSLFFTRAGLNFPDIYLSLGLDLPVPPLPVKVNPLPTNLVWIRGIDSEPVLTSMSKIERRLNKV